MKPHREAQWSFAKMALAVGALAVAAGLALGGGKGGPPPDFGNLFKVTDVKDEPKKKPKRSKPRPADEPPPMTCDGDQCWWTDLGRPK